MPVVIVNRNVACMQWNRDSNVPDTDGFEIKRFGTEPIRVWVSDLSRFTFLLCGGNYKGLVPMIGMG